MSNLSDFTGGGSPKKWVSGTYAEGLVMWSPSDYQYYMNKTTGVRATDPANDATNWQPTGDRAIKSIQRGAITISGSASATATISSVNTAKCELRFLGFESNNTDTQTCPRITLTNSTTITAVRAVAGNYTAVNWELTERY